MLLSRTIDGGDDLTIAPGDVTAGAGEADSLHALGDVSSTPLLGVLLLRREEEKVACEEEEAKLEVFTLEAKWKLRPGSSLGPFRPSRELSRFWENVRDLVA